MLFAHHEKKFVWSALLGSAIEGYDFLVYMFFSDILAKVFFAFASDFSSTLMVYLIFAAGYLARPIGGILFSHFGDRYGRRITFFVSIVMMTVSILGVGLLPTGAQIGALAPILLLILRFMQGLSFAGELPGAVTFVAEHVEKTRRSTATATLYFGINLGLTLASLVGTSVTLFLTKEQLLEWGWRIPFLLGAGLGVISFFMRRNIHETQAFLKLKQEKKIVRIPLLQLFRAHKKTLGYGFLFAILGALMPFFFLFTPNYLLGKSIFSKELIFSINTISTLLFSFFILFWGYCSDRWGGLKIYLFSALAIGLFSYPLYRLLLTGNIYLFSAAFLLFPFLAGMALGSYPALLVSLFQPAVRFTGVAVCLNVAQLFFAGLSPLICLSLSKALGLSAAPGLYFSGVGLLVFSILFWRMRAKAECLTNNQTAP